MFLALGLTDGSGKTIDFTSTVVIMAFNLGTIRRWSNYEKQIENRSFKAYVSTKKKMKTIVKKELMVE